MLRLVNSTFQRNLQCALCSLRFNSTATSELYQIKAERIEEISKSPSGWVPRANPPPGLSFDVDRSRTNNLPVYVNYKAGRTKVITSIRKVRGDIKELEKCVRHHLGDDYHYQINELTNQLHIKGQHKDQIVRLLKELGF